VALSLALACAGQRPRTASQDATQRESADDAEGRAEALVMRGRWTRRGRSSIVRWRRHADQAVGLERMW